MRLVSRCLVSSGLTHILQCTDPVELEELSFAVANSHFGALQTIELEAGGLTKTVTMENRSDYVFQMCHWYLTGTYTHHTPHTTNRDVHMLSIHVDKKILFTNSIS